jgi:hypothetical protein
MKIETKYDIEDKVRVKDRDKIMTIRYIEIQQYKDYKLVWYWMEEKITNILVNYCFEEKDILNKEAVDE